MRKLLAVALTICATAAYGADKKVLVADSATYSTTLIASSSTAIQWNVIQPGCVALAPTPITANGAAVRDTKGQFCSAFVLADSTPGVDVRSIVHFSDGISESSFIVPPLGAITADQPSTLGPAINTDSIGSYLAFVSDKPSAVTITIYDGSWIQIGTETHDVPKGGSIYRIVTPFRVGFVRVTLGYSQFGVVPNLAPLYGFLTVATPRNGNSIVYPFGQ